MTTEKAPSGAADGGLSAIIMEYLPGEDMHLLRDRHCQSLLEKSENGGGGTLMMSGGAGEKIPRRLSVQDSVYLVADVMLPLLKAMHEVGIVHRDVKPSVRLKFSIRYDHRFDTFSFLNLSFRML